MFDLSDAQIREAMTKIKAMQEGIQKEEPEAFASAVASLIITLQVCPTPTVVLLMLEAIYFSGEQVLKHREEERKRCQMN